jgi:4-amino-4-deoxy-L-arabinose transferase-like glycosyltransferase
MTTSPQSRTAAILRWAQSAPVIVAVAFLVRLINVIQHHVYQISGDFNNLYFGYEVGRIAQSVVSGHGFSSPFPAWSGPTAWLGPLYPLLLAAVFKVFGVYSLHSAFAILTINAIFSALTCATIFLIGEEVFGHTVAWASAWLWALLPYATFWSTYIWDTSLATLLLSLVFLLTLRMDRDPRLRNWILYGVLWGLIALTNASVLSFLPVSAVWLWYRLRRHIPFARMVMAAFLFCAVVSPWVVRNYHVFGKFVFPRSDFGEELYMGNHEGSEGLCMFWDHPVWNTYEMADFQRMGELRYVAAKQKIAAEWIRQNPGRFAVLTLRRIGFFWFDIPEQGRMANHFGMGSRHALYFGAALLAFWGLWMCWGERRRGSFLFAGLFLLYPAVYYITHCHPRYQHPITPEMLLMGVFLIHATANPEANRQPRTVKLSEGDQSRSEEEAAAASTQNR